MDSNTIHLRPFEFNGLERRIPPTVSSLFPFPLTVKQLVNVVRVGNRLTLTARPASGGTTSRQAWIDPAIGRWGSGHIGFRTRAQDCIIEDLTITAA